MSIKCIPLQSVRVMSSRAVAVMAWALYALAPLPVCLLLPSMSPHDDKIDA